MFFSLSIIPDKASKKNQRSVPFSDKIITYFILFIWALLILFAFISILGPQWLTDLSESGKLREVMNTKIYGDRFLKKNDFRNAIIQYKAALEIKPDFYFALGNLAVVYSKLGDFDKAIPLLKKMIELKPATSHIALQNLAEIYEKEDKLEESIYYYSRAAETAPFPSYLYSKLGNLYCTVDSCEKAVAAFRKSITERSDLASSYRGMLTRDYYKYSDSQPVQDAIKPFLENGLPEHEMDRFDLTVFNSELLNDREYAIAFNNLGWAYQMNDQYENALISYNNAIKLNPRYLQAINNREAILKLMERSER